MQPISLVVEQRLDGAIRELETLAAPSVNVHKKITDLSKKLHLTLDTAVLQEPNPDKQVSIQHRIGALQALRELEKSGLPPANVLAAYAAERVAIKDQPNLAHHSKMWNADDVEYVADNRALKRGYRLIDPLSPIDRNRVNVEQGSPASAYHEYIASGAPADEIGLLLTPRRRIKLAEFSPRSSELLRRSLFPTDSKKSKI